MLVEENVVSPYEFLEKRELEVLSELEARGFTSPFEEFSESLIDGDNRRFLKEIKEIDYCQIKENQVAKNLIDRHRCENVLKPWIEKEGLQNPSLVEEPSFGDVYNQITGHNRAYAEDMIRGKVTVIVCSKNYNLSGNAVPADIGVLQGARSNKPAMHRSYQIQDAAITLADSFRKNPTQEGLNPSGQFPPRHDADGFDFDDFIDRVYNKDKNGDPVKYAHFPDKGTRTKIRNKMIKNANASKIIDMTVESAKTNHLNRLGWNNGLNSKGKRKRVHEHFDTDRNSIIIMTDDSGTNYEGFFFTLIKKWHSEASGFKQIIKSNEIKYVDVCARIYNPDTDKASIDTARNKFKDKIREIGNTMYNCGVDLKVRLVAFPKQLQSSQDGDKIFNLS